MFRMFAESRLLLLYPCIFTFPCHSALYTYFVIFTTSHSVLRSLGVMASSRSEFDTGPPSTDKQSGDDGSDDGTMQEPPQLTAEGGENAYDELPNESAGHVVKEEATSDFDEISGMLHVAFRLHIENYSKHTICLGYNMMLLNSTSMPQDTTNPFALAAGLTMSQYSEDGSATGSSNYKNAGRKKSNPVSRPQSQLLNVIILGLGVLCGSPRKGLHRRPMSILRLL